MVIQVSYRGRPIWGPGDQLDLVGPPPQCLGNQGLEGTCEYSVRCAQLSVYIVQPTFHHHGDAKCICKKLCIPLVCPTFTRCACAVEIAAQTQPFSRGGSLVIAPSVPDDALITIYTRVDAISPNIKNAHLLEGPVVNGCSRQSLSVVQPVHFWTSWGTHRSARHFGRVGQWIPLVTQSWGSHR